MVLPVNINIIVNNYSLSNMQFTTYQHCHYLVTMQLSETFLCVYCMALSEGSPFFINDKFVDIKLMEIEKILVWLSYLCTIAWVKKAAIETCQNLQRELSVLVFTDKQKPIYIWKTLVNFLPVKTFLPLQYLLFTHLLESLVIVVIEKNHNTIVNFDINYFFRDNSLCYIKKLRSPKILRARKMGFLFGPSLSSLSQNEIKNEYNSCALYIFVFHSKLSKSTMNVQVHIHEYY